MKTLLKIGKCLLCVAVVIVGVLMVLGGLGTTFLGITWGMSLPHIIGGTILATLGVLAVISILRVYAYNACDSVRARFAHAD